MPERGCELRVRGALPERCSEGRAQQCRRSKTLAAWVAGSARRRRWHRGMVGRKLKAICGNKPEMQGREGRAGAAERYKYLRQHLAGSRRPEPYDITDLGWPDISVRSQALIRCGKCSVTVPERVYVQNRCLLAGAGAVAHRHFINYISLPLP